MRLTLRTLLAYLDDTLPPEQAKAIGQKVTESETARELIDRLRKITRRRGLSTPTTGENGGPSDPNTVADYLSDALTIEQIAQFEKTCLDSDVHLAEVAACHQILTLLLSEPVRVPPTARQRMYQLVKGPESHPGRKPGNTVPVAGELPESPPTDADDTDAAYLLGMRAYSRSEPLRKRAAPLAALVGLVAALALTIWLAFPAPRRAAELQPTTGGGMVATSATIPFTPRGPGAVSGGGPPSPPDKAATNGKPAVVPPSTTAPKDDVKPGPPPVGDLAPATAKPRVDRVAVGKVENPDAVVVAQTGPDGRWLRATAKEPGVTSTDRVVCLPGYKSKVRVEPATEFELWGNTPEQQPQIPVLETAVTFYAPAEGFDAELAVHAGRVYVVAKRPAGAKLRLRFKEEVWDLTIPDDKTEVVAEVVNSLVRGVTRDLDASELPHTAVAVAVTRGAAGLKVRYKDLPQVKANEVVTWTSKGPGLNGPTPVPGNGSAYFSRYELPVGEQAKAAQQALTDLSARASERDAVQVVFAEMLRDDRPVDSLARAVAAKVAVLGHAALGDLPPVIDALNDANRPFIRESAAYALPYALASAPDGVEVFRRRLGDKLGVKDEQTALAVRLVRGFSDEERRNAAALDQVTEALSHKDLVIRELAYRNLYSLMGPDAQPAQAALMYNAGIPQEVREQGVKAWKRFVEDLKQKAAKEPAKK